MRFYPQHPRPFYPPLEVGESEYDPSVLFTSGRNGFAILAHPDYSFTDTARTTPAAVDATVAGVTDLSGKGNHPVHGSAGPALKHDGSNYYFDFPNKVLNTPAVNLSALSKMLVVGAVYKGSDASSAIVLEHGTSGTHANLVTPINAPRSTATANYGADLRSSGQASTAQTAASYAAPITNVLTTMFDYGGASAAAKCRMRVDQGSWVTASSGAPTGTFANAAFNIGRRSNGSLGFTGRIYALLAVAYTDTITDEEIAEVEAWAAALSGVTL